MFNTVKMIIIQCCAFHIICRKKLSVITNRFGSYLIPCTLHTLAMLFTKRVYSKGEAILVFLIFGFSLISILKDFLYIKTFKTLDRRKWWEDMFCNETNFNNSNPQFQKLKLRNFLIDVYPDESAFNNIYLIQNDCNRSLSLRFLCAAESAARHNSQSTVWFLTLTSSVIDEGSILSTLLRDVPNIVPCTTDLNLLFKGTPFQSFDSTNKWTYIEDFKHAHVSDVMRLALIWSFGGTYLDADIISLRKLPTEPNVLVLDAPLDIIINGVLKANRHHRVFEKLIRYVASYYDGESWSANGPLAISKIMRFYCQVNKYFKSGKCEDFLLLKSTQYQPIPPDRIKRLYAPNGEMDISDILEDSYGIHLNNHLYQHEVVEIGKNSIFDRIAKRHCPIVYKEMVKRTVI